MKRMYIGTGTCVLIIIAFVLIAGCAFLNPGNTPAQPATQGATPTPVTQPLRWKPHRQHRERHRYQLPLSKPHRHHPE